MARIVPALTRALRHASVVLCVCSVFTASKTDAQTAGSAMSTQPQAAGCVTEIPSSPDNLVLATGTRCLLLIGEFNSAKLRNHEVVLGGTELKADDPFPDRFDVTITTKIGGACTRTCTLEAPESRGAQGGSGGAPMPNSGPPAPNPSTDKLPRVTGTALLVTGAKEAPGYGLYSYALLSHAPDADRLHAVQSFFASLYAQSTAHALAGVVPLQRINITETPVTGSTNEWDSMSVDRRTTFALNHYDYARAAAIVAALPQHVGAGPVIISLLHPIDVSQRPDPVLVMDLSLAQPRLMGAEVDAFVEQAKRDQFWQRSTLSQLGLTLSNTLEVAASGLGMGKEMVKGWVTMFSSTR